MHAAAQREPLHTRTMTSFELRARVSFPGVSRDFAGTGRAMAAWAEAAARALAPELAWRAEIAEDDDLASGERWGSSHVVVLTGEDADGVRRGRGKSLLIAGGKGSRIGGNGLVEIETVRPARYLGADNHCNVEHWDLVAAPIDERTFDAIRSALEDAVGERARVAGERRDPIEPGAQLIVSSASAEDIAVWIEDLATAGLAARGQAAERGIALFLERASLEDVGALERARVTLGEVLSEAGREDWDERWRELLVRLPAR